MHLYNNSRHLLAEEITGQLGETAVSWPFCISVTSLFIALAA